MEKIKVITKQGFKFHEFEEELYPDYLMKGNGMSWIQNTAEKYCKGKGLDIGAGSHPFPGSYAIDAGKQSNAYNLPEVEDRCLDYVFSSHCLEHLGDWSIALTLWVSKLKKNGILFLYLPHESMKLWHPNNPWGGEHVWIPTVEILDNFLEQGLNMTVINCNFLRDVFWSFHIVARKN